MTHADFRRKQAEMDEAGFITCIKHYRISKILVRVDRKYDDELVNVYRYKYKYEVILNGAIIHTCKSRRTAKKRLLNLYEEKMVVMSI